MSGSHPVASGSIPGIGYIILEVLVLLAQLAEHPLNILAFLAQSAERCANNFSPLFVDLARGSSETQRSPVRSRQKALLFLHAPVV